MTRRAPWRWAARRVPQTVRVRLSVTYALLFLAAGAALLAVTYGLVANSLPRTAAGARFTSTQAAKLARACKQAEQSTPPGSHVTTVTDGATSVSAPAAKPPPAHASKRLPVQKPVPASCRKVFAAGANAATTSQRDQTLHNLLLYSLIALGAMTLVSGGLGWVMAGRVLRPVRTITGAARRASERHLGERLGLQGPRDEFRELADTFDGMLDRLDAAFATQQRFVADASHELRTPLTVMRTAIDVTLAKPSRSPEQLEAMAAKVRRSVDQAERLIEDLLTLATSERAASNREFVDLATTVEDALDAAEPGIAALDLRLDTDLEPAETTGDRLLLERLVSNLVDNAVRHNVPGGWIRVRTGSNAGAHLEVANSGQEIPAEAVESLFEPFRRIEERINIRDGFGLGLAIVKSISAAHGASVDARPQPEGGLVVSLSLPRPDGLDGSAPAT